MRVFVTGAGGFIGSALCRKLAGEYGAGSVTCLVRDPSAAAELRARGFRVVQADILDTESYREELLAAETVFHLGALAVFGKRLDYGRNNVEATRGLMRVASESKILKLFVFTSTIGAVDRAPWDPCRNPLTGASPCHPQSAYGRSKLECERLVAASGLPWVIVRPSWVYGPGMRPGSHMAAFILDALNGGVITRIGFAGRVSVIHVEDMAGFLAHLVRRGERRVTVFASDGEPRSFGEVFGLIRAALGKGDRGMIFPARPMFRLLHAVRGVIPFTARCLAGDVLVCTGDELRALGYEPRIRFEDGLRETVAWFQGFRDGRVLITGAAGGIGRAMALQLASRGGKLYLVDRDAAGLARLAAETGGKAFHADLSDPGASRRVFEWVRDQGEPVFGLVNNAGLGFRGGLVKHPPDRAEEILRVNLLATVALTRLFLPDMLRHGSGRILNIASSIASVPLPGMSVYGASKAGVLSFSRSLWAETRGTGVTVTCVSPSGTFTGFQRAAGVRVLNDGKGLMSPDAVARAALDAWDKGRMDIVIGWRSRLLIAVTAVLPARLRALLWRELMRSMR